MQITTHQELTAEVIKGLKNAEDSLAREQKALAKQASSGQVWAKDLATTCRIIAGLEANVRWFSTLSTICANTTGDFEQAVAAIRNHGISLLVIGPDDAWSGRGNDTERAAHDALRKTIQRMLETI